jgi:hypothetical protein
MYQKLMVIITNYSDRPEIARTRRLAHSGQSGRASDYKRVGRSATKGGVGQRYSWNCMCVLNVLNLRM